MNKKLQKGFTLIELMIVVAIIGILASIALPTYQNYIARSQASESIVMLSSARTALEVQIIAARGEFPNNMTEVTALVPVTGKYGSITAVTKDTSFPDAGDIVYTFLAGSANANLTNASSNTVTYSRTSVDGNWSCSATIPAKYIKGCI